MTRWGLVLRISGAPVPRAEVFRRHEGMEIAATPRGGSLDEETAWSRREPWGQLSFGFAERDPDRLRSILIAGTGW